MWEERFAREDYVFGTEPASFLIRRAALFTPGLSLLSVAEGEGRNAVHLAKQGLNVTGVEFAPSAIAKAKKLAAKNGVAPTFLNANLMQWDWPDAAFDITLGVFIQFTGAKDRAAMFKNMQQATKPGGLVVLHGYTPEQLTHGTGGPSTLENLYTADTLAAEFDGWHIELCEAYEREITEGSGHSGLSALIDFAARKPV